MCSLKINSLSYSNTMTLRKKTLLIVGISLMGLLGLLFTVSSTILLKGFTQLEYQAAQDNTRRLIDVLEDELGNLATEVEDYAEWDDTYQYMETQDDIFILSNLGQSTFDNLNLNSIALVNLNGQIVFGQGYDLITDQLRPFSQEHIENITKKLSSVYDLTKNKIRGFIQLNEGMLMIATNPVLTSKKQGPSRGVLIMGRYLDHHRLERLQKLIHLSIHLQSVKIPQLPLDFSKAYFNLLDTQQESVVQILDQERIAGYALIKDLYQQPQALLRVELPREIYYQGLTTIRYLNGFVLLLALLFAALILWLFERLVLARLATLSHEVRRIRATDHLSTVTVVGRDELAHLALTINEMISALRTSYLRVRQSEASLAEAQRIAHVGNWEWEITTNHVQWSDEVYRILGFKPQSCSPDYLLFLERVHPEDRKMVTQTFEESVKEGKTYSIEHRIVQKEGEERIVHTRGEVLHKEGYQTIYMIGTLQDITEIKQAQAETVRLLEENRFLIHRSMAIQEAERRDLTRELHDEFGQWITAIQADAETIVELARIEPTLARSEKIGISADAILTIATQMYDLVHSLIRQLRPSGLDELGLVESLREIITAWQKRYPEVQCRFTVSDDFRNMEENINITLYRIVQECLTNIAKYSKATVVTIRLQMDATEETLTLEVIDNGQGMHPVQHKRGLGLIGMRERVEALLGKMSLETAPGCGVKIAIKIPIAEEYQQKYKSWKK
ncbi:MAG: hypothetical protein BWK79_09310 [Beggiatoa sp. IS2]|nr:MAG: hypothetical protein BWK79_09310 [Beggiatoa sp. IS2]